MASAPEHFPVKHAFGQLVLVARLRLDWSQEKLAELAGVSRDTISDIENGKTNPCLLTMNSVALALGNSFAGFCIPWQPPET